VGVQPRLDSDCLDMDIEYRLPALAVGTIEGQLAIEAAGAQKRGIQHLRPVRRAEQHDTHARIEAVEFGQQLVERLFLFVTTAHLGKGRPRSSKRVELVDKDDAGRGLAGLLEQVPDTSRADANKE